MKYEFPEGIVISGIEGIMLDEKTRLAIIGAAEWMEENPNFEPKFEKLFNVILAKDRETVAMTEAVFTRAGVKEDEFLPRMPFLGVDFSTYCIAVTMIHQHGWYVYIHHLYKRFSAHREEQVKSEEFVI